MASPQCDDGFTKIANELMEALCRYRIAGEERQILDVIFRKTYGWDKKQDAISYGQFMSMTGLTKGRVARSLQKLRDKKIIMVLNIEYGTQKRVPKDPTKVYGINKDFEKWLGYSKMSTVLNIVQKGYSKVRPTKETIQKKKKPPTPFNGKIPEWLNPEAWQSFLQHRKAKRSPMTESAIKLTLKKLDEFRQKGQDPFLVLEQSILQGWTGIFELKSDIRKVDPDDHYSNYNESTNSVPKLTEMTLLAACFAEGVPPRCDPEHFYFERHRFIAEIMFDLYRQNLPIDLVNVWDKSQSLNPGFVSATMLAEISDYATSGKNIQPYSDSIKRHATLRKMKIKSEAFFQCGTVSADGIGELS